MIADGLDRMVLLLLVAGGAALALGAVGIVNPAWATDHAWFLTMAGAAVPFLSVVAVHVRQSMLDADASREHTYADAERLRAQAESSRRPQDTPAVTPGSPTSQIGGDLGQVDSLNDEWLSASHRFLRAGDVIGFPIRVMVGRGIVSWDDWGKLASVLTAAGIMVKSPRAGWAEHWDMLRWTKERHNLTLPHGGLPAPDVALIPTTTTNNGYNTAPEVVDGTSKPLTS